MSGPKKTIDSHANREMPKSDGLAYAVMQLIESPHIVNLNTEIKQLKEENASLQTGNDKLHAENIVQRERFIASHENRLASFARLTLEKDMRIKQLESEKGLDAIEIKHLTRSKDGITKLLEKQYSELSARYDELHIKSMNMKGRFSYEEVEEIIKRNFAKGVKAIEAVEAKTKEESDTYVGKCLECGEILHSDTRQLCGKYVCHNA